MRCSKRAKRGFKSIDLFGQTVSLTWNGEEEYKSILGAAVSTVILVLLIAYTIYRFYAMTNRLSPLMSLTKLIRQVEDSEPYRPQELGFQFGFGLKAPLDPSIGFFSATYVQVN